jgi:hypothetical protein
MADALELRRNSGMAVQAGHILGVDSRDIISTECIGIGLIKVETVDGNVALVDEWKEKSYRSMQPIWEY